VTAESSSSKDPSVFATAAYQAATGAKLWVRRYGGPGNLSNIATTIRVAPDGSLVFITGQSESQIGGGEDYATVAYTTS
jgi:hypothetical protein